MNSRRMSLLVLLLSLSAASFAQMDHKTTAAPPTEAQKSFTAIKTLAGQWEGSVTLNPPMKGTDFANMHVSMRVTSRGNALVHEMNEASKPDDPAKHDHPVTMFYIDGDQLYLTHYCDAGNRPRMTGKVSPDGKKVEFDFADLSGSDKLGHMYHAVFTIIDADHHTEDWTYMMPGDKAMKAHMDLQRKKDATSAAGQ